MKKRENILKWIIILLFCFIFGGVIGLVHDRNNLINGYNTQLDQKDSTIATLNLNLNLSNHFYDSLHWQYWDEMDRVYADSIALFQCQQAYNQLLHSCNGDLRKGYRQGQSKTYSGSNMIRGSYFKWDKNDMLPNFYLVDSPKEKSGVYLERKSGTWTKWSIPEAENYWDSVFFTLHHYRDSVGNMWTLPYIPGDSLIYKLDKWFEWESWRHNQKSDSMYLPAWY